MWHAGFKRHLPLGNHMCQWKMIPHTPNQQWHTTKISAYATQTEVAVCMQVTICLCISKIVCVWLGILTPCIMSVCSHFLVLALSVSTFSNYVRLFWAESRLAQPFIFVWVSNSVGISNMWCSVTVFAPRTQALHNDSKLSNCTQQIKKNKIISIIMHIIINHISSLTPWALERMQPCASCACASNVRYALTVPFETTTQVILSRRSRHPLGQLVTRCIISPIFINTEPVVQQLGPFRIWNFDLLITAFPLGQSVFLC